MNTEKTTFVILTPSALGFGRRPCFLGEGSSEKEAWLDALGPKPWTSWTKKVKRNAWCEEVSEDQLWDIRNHMHD